MTIKETIIAVTASLLLIFNAGMGARIGKIFFDGQVDEDQNTNKMIRNHVKAIIVGNTITGLVITIESFYR